MNENPQISQMTQIFLIGEICEICGQFSKERPMRRKVLLCFVFVVAVFVAGLSADSAAACGGLFCQNSPVDQNAERIIFTHNEDGSH
jgi:hypothetical protein